MNCFVLVDILSSLSEGSLAQSLKKGCKSFNFSLLFLPCLNCIFLKASLACGFSILLLATCQWNYCLLVSANLLAFPSPSLLYGGEILNHNTLSEAFANQLKMSLLTAKACWDTNSTKAFFTILSVFFACYQGQFLKIPPLSSTH